VLRVSTAVLRVSTAGLRVCARAVVGAIYVCVHMHIIVCVCVCVCVVEYVRSESRCGMCFRVRSLRNCFIPTAEHFSHIVFVPHSTRKSAKEKLDG
jgi:hypothetical protein